MLPEGWVLDQFADLAAKEKRKRERDDESGSAVKGEVSGPGSGANDRQPAGHSFGRRVSPACPPLSADIDIGLTENPGHPVLGQVEVKIMGDAGFDERARVLLIPADEGVKKNEAQPREFSGEAFHGPNDIFNPLAALVDTAITEDVYRLALGLIGEGVKDVWIDPAWRPVTANPVFSLHAPADALGIPEKKEIFPDDLFFFFMAFENKIEIFRPGFELFKLRKDGIFTA